MANQTPNQPGFLGKGELKFNKAGENNPMSGEKVADAPEPPRFGGPKVWIGTAVIIIAMLALYFVVSSHSGTATVQGHGGVSSEGAPGLDPDNK